MRLFIVFELQIGGVKDCLFVLLNVCYWGKVMLVWEIVVLQVVMLFVVVIVDQWFVYVKNLKCGCISIVYVMYIYDIGVCFDGNIYCDGLYLQQGWVYW